MAVALASAPAPDLAISVRRAKKSYAGGEPILQGLNMSVPRGCIYGLLGASGCGKTTLLSCIVGRRQLDEGKIRVLGLPPGSPGSCIPGPRVGFMPQSIALVEEFTVRETLHYFSMLYGMDEETTDGRLSFLGRLLDLPPEDRFIKNLSGGQQRRVSFAVTLLSQPQMLILDEPTVGLDPVLRQAIWEYLVEISVAHKVTVIVTTHYIEECRGAHKIGLMRQGRLLAENSPQHLLTQFNVDTLEDVFLNLCVKQQTNNGEETNQVINNFINAQPTENEYPSPPSSATTLHRQVDIKFKSSSYSRFKALLLKNYIRLLRNPGGLAFLIVFPILQMSLYFGAVGETPKGLHLAIVNEEIGNMSDCTQYREMYEYGATPSRYTCNLLGVSCMFLDRINSSVGIKDFYKDYKSGLKAVKSGRAVAIIHFKKNFSRTLQIRDEQGRRTPDKDVEESLVTIQLDMTDFQIAHLLQNTLYDIYYDVSDNITGSCNKNSKIGKIPVVFKEPIYGESNLSFAVGMIPGNVIMIIYFLSTVLTSTAFIEERLAGIWDRNLLAGVTNPEMFFSHVVSQLTNVLVQCTVLIIVCWGIFSAPCKGSLPLAFLLVYLQGVAGMTFGLLVSTVTDNLTFANYMAIGSFMPAYILGGIIWPLEGMPAFLKVLSVSLPGTLASFSLRHIMIKGWNITNLPVLRGYLITIGWITGQCALCLLVLRLRKN